jgi:mycothiol synthase
MTMSPDQPAAHSFELRPLDASLFNAMAALQTRSDLHDGIPRVTTADEFEEELDDDHIRLADDTRGAFVGDRLVGYAYQYHLPSEVREERCYVFGEVDPDYRRRGVGSALMRWAIPRAEALLRTSTNDLPKYIRVDHDDVKLGDAALFASLDMRQVRWNEELLRPLDELPPVPPADAIAGLRIVPLPDDRDEDVRYEKNTSFADHWGSTPTTEHHWQQQVRGMGARPDLSFIALDDTDTVVAHCLVKRFPDDDAVLGRREAWLDSIGTLRAWRGKGLASAMIAHALHALAADGLTHAALGVDADNPSGAARLYRRLGFERQRGSTTWEIAL